MNIILLSGGSGKRLWPLSNDVRSKQFIKLFKDGNKYESMVQRVYRQITTVDSPVRNISFASGCLMLIPIGAVQKVGLLEEKYFLYSEDTDYCCRIRKAGLNILFCEKAVIYHKVSASTGKNSDSMTYYTTRNKLYIARDFTTNRYSAYARITLQLLKDVIRGRKRLSPIVGGYRSFFKNEVGMMPKN